MNVEKAKTIQRYFNYFRLAIIIIVIGLLVFLSYLD